MFFNRKNKDPKKLKKKSGLKMPSTITLLFLLLGVVVLISWLVYWYSGANPHGDYHPAGILDIFMAPIKGFQLSAEIIVFLFMLSAFLKIVNTSKALDAGIGRLFLIFKGKEKYLIIILFYTFVICGTTFGMCEASLPFYFLLIPILLAAGFDTYVAVLVILFGAGIGVLCSTINPVLIQNAFNAANNGIRELYPEAQILPIATGIVWRIVSLIVLSLFIVCYILWYLKRIQTRPSKFIVYDSNNKPIADTDFQFNQSDIPELTKQRKIILTIFILTFVMLIFGAVPWDKVTGANAFELLGTVLAKNFPYFAGQRVDMYGNIVSNINDVGSWSLLEMGFLFFAASFVAGIACWKGEEQFIKTVIEGMSEFIPVVVICSVATGFSVILSTTGIQNALISSISSMKDAANPYLFTLFIFVIFFIISIFIPSMSGFSRTVFPTVGPALSGGVSMVNGVNMTVSGAVLTFSMANGLVNLCSPTAGIFLIAIQICKIPLSKFYANSKFLIFGITFISIGLLLIGSALPEGLF